MTLHKTDFVEYLTGSQPTGWTKRYATTNITYTVETSDWALAPGKCLHVVNSATARKMFSWDALDGTQNFSALALVKISNINTATAAWGLYFRSSGGAGSETTYWFNSVANPGDFRFGRVVSGSGTIGSGGLIRMPGGRDDMYLWMRWSVSGSAMKFKMWRFDSVEPNEWHIEITDTTISAAGWFGFGARYATDYRIYWLGVDDAATVSVPDVWRESTNWGMNQVDADTLTGAGALINSFVVQGELYNLSNTFLKSVSVKFGTHTLGKDIRLGAYSGGAANDPAGASLLADFGLTSGSGAGWVTLVAGNPVLIPAGQYLWIAAKSNETTGVNINSTTTRHYASNIQSLRGRGINTTMSVDEQDPYPATYTGGVTFSGAWYAMRLGLWLPPPMSVFGDLHGYI